MSRLVLASAALLFVLLASASAARAGFAPADDEVITAPNLSVSLSGLGTDAQGNSLIAWEEQPAGYAVKARRIGPDGTLGPVLDLDPERVGRDPVVAMGASGRAFVAWQAPLDPPAPNAAGVRGRWVEADGTLGPVLTLVVGKEDELAAAGLLATVDPAGVATVAWKNEIGGNGGELMLRRVQPDGTLSALVPDATGTKPGAPEIAALPNGSTLIVFDNAFLERVVVGPSLELGARTPISNDNMGAEQLLAVDSQGNGFVTWRHDSESAYGFRGRLLDPSGNPVGDELILEADLPEIPDNADLAVDSADDFLAIWYRRDAEGDSIVYARPFNRLGGLGPTQTVSNEDLNSASPSGAIDDFGTGAIAWNEFVGMGTRNPRGTSISTLGSPIGPEQVLSSRTFVSTASSSPVAGVVVFQLTTPFNGTNRTALVRRFLVPPRCADSEVTRTKAGALTVPLSCVGAGIEGAEIVKAAGGGVLGTFNAAGPTLLYSQKPGAGGNDSFSYRAVTDGGSSNLATVTIRDRLKPVIRKLRFVKPKTRKGARSSAKKRQRPYFSLRLSEPAKARVTVERRGKGRRFVKVGKVGARKARRILKLPVSPKLAARIAKGGRLRATAVATDQAGNRSKRRRAAIRAPRHG